MKSFTLVVADRHLNVVVCVDAVPSSSQHASGAAVAEADSSDGNSHNTTSRSHAHSEPRNVVRGPDLRDAQNRGKRKGAAMVNVTQGGAQKKHRSAPDVQAQHITQVAEPLNREHGSRNSQTQSLQQCASTALQSVDSNVARACISLLALHRTTAEGPSIDSDDINVVGG